MAIKMTNAVFENVMFGTTMEKVNETQMGPKDAYWINRITNKLGELGKDFITAKQKVLEKYQDNDVEPTEDGMVQIPKENIEEFTKEFQVLLDIEIEIPFDKRAYPEALELSPQEIGAIESVFDMSSLEG